MKNPNELLRFRRDDVYYIESYQGKTLVHFKADGHKMVRGVVPEPIAEVAEKMGFPCALADTPTSGFAINFDKVADMAEGGYRKDSDNEITLSFALSAGESVLNGTYQIRFLEEFGPVADGTVVTFKDSLTVTFPLPLPTMENLRRAAITNHAKASFPSANNDA